MLYNFSGPSVNRGSSLVSAHLAALAQDFKIRDFEDEEPEITCIPGSRTDTIGLTEDKVLEAFYSAEPSIVQILSKKDRNQAIGTGFFVTSVGHILTNCHGECEAKLRDGSIVLLDLSFEISRLDIACYKIPNFSQRIVPLRPAAPSLGDSILLMGFHEAFDRLQFRTGKVDFMKADGSCSSISRLDGKKTGGPVVSFHPTSAKYYGIIQMDSDPTLPYDQSHFSSIVAIIEIALQNGIDLIYD